MTYVEKNDIGIFCRTADLPYRDGIRAWNCGGDSLFPPDGSIRRRRCQRSDKHPRTVWNSPDCNVENGGDPDHFLFTGHRSGQSAFETVREAGIDGSDLVLSDLGFRSSVRNGTCVSDESGDGKRERSFRIASIPGGNYKSRGIGRTILPAVSEMLPDSSGERVHKNTNSIFPETFQPAGTKFRVLSTSPPLRRKAGLTIIFPVPTGSAEPEIRAEILRGNFLHGAYNHSAARQNNFIADILCAGKHIEELRPVQLYCRPHGTIPSSLI